MGRISHGHYGQLWEPSVHRSSLGDVASIRPAAAQRFIFFTGHRNNPAIDFFFQCVHATVLIKPFKLEALDATMSEVFHRLV